MFVVCLHIFEYNIVEESKRFLMCILFGIALEAKDRLMEIHFSIVF